MFTSGATFQVTNRKNGLTALYTVHRVMGRGAKVSFRNQDGELTVIDMTKATDLRFKEVEA